MTESILSLSGLKIKLKLVGPISNNQSKENLFLQIRNTNVNKKIISYYGVQNKRKIAKLMSNSDLFLFGSSCESFGLTLLEGMASNLAIISSNKSGLNLTSRNKAIYFDPLNVKSIKRSITKFLNLNDLERRKNSIETKKIAKNYDWKKTSNLTFTFLKKIEKFIPLGTSYSGRFLHRISLWLECLGIRFEKTGTQPLSGLD